jgi:hypothetical protein
VPFTEEDFRRRKPHPNFREHLTAEKTVIKLGKTVSFWRKILKNYKNFCFFK